MQGEGKKYEILRVLKEKSPEFISGEELSKLFGISRTAVWKYINNLKADGYVLEASSRIGYKLVSGPFVYNGYEMSNNLGTAVIGKKIIYFDSLDSTNNHAKRIASKETEGLVIVAGSQSDGRGRLGRAWNSPCGAGIYLSIILKPVLPPEEVQIITLAAAVAVVRAIEKITGIKPGIKWPNDVLLEGRKVCGILTEMNTEIERINFIVLGIGINHTRQQEEFPIEIRDKATSLSAFAGSHGMDIEKWNRLDIIRAVMLEMDKFYQMILVNSFKEIIDKWKEYSVTLGRKVRIISGDTEYTAVAEDITNDGKLVVRCSDGEIRLVQSGEISLKHRNL